MFMSYCDGLADVALLAALFAAFKAPFSWLWLVYWTSWPAYWIMTTQSLIKLLSLTTCFVLIIFLKLFSFQLKFIRSLFICVLFDY